MNWQTHRYLQEHQHDIEDYAENLAEGFYELGEGNEMLNRFNRDDQRKIGESVIDKMDALYQYNETEMPRFQHFVWRAFEEALETRLIAEYLRDIWLDKAAEA